MLGRPSEEPHHVLGTLLSEEVKAFFVSTWRDVFEAHALRLHLLVQRSAGSLWYVHLGNDRGPAQYLNLLLHAVGT